MFITCFYPYMYSIINRLLLTDYFECFRSKGDMYPWNQVAYYIQYNQALNLLFRYSPNPVFSGSVAFISDARAAKRRYDAAFTTETDGENKNKMESAAENYRKAMFILDCYKVFSKQKTEGHIYSYASPHYFDMQFGVESGSIEYSVENSALKLPVFECRYGATSTHCFFDTPNTIMIPRHLMFSKEDMKKTKFDNKYLENMYKIHSKSIIFRDAKGEPVKLDITCLDEQDYTNIMWRFRTAGPQNYEYKRYEHYTLDIKSLPNLVFCTRIDDGLIVTKEARLTREGNTLILSKGGDCGLPIFVCDSGELKLYGYHIAAAVSGTVLPMVSMVVKPDGSGVYGFEGDADTNAFNAQPVRSKDLYYSLVIGLVQYIISRGQPKAIKIRNLHFDAMNEFIFLDSNQSRIKKGWFYEGKKEDIFSLLNHVGIARKEASNIIGNVLKWIGYYEDTPDEDFINKTNHAQILPVCMAYYAPRLDMEVIKSFLKKSNSTYVEALSRYPTYYSEYEFKNYVNVIYYFFVRLAMVHVASHNFYWYEELVLLTIYFPVWRSISYIGRDHGFWALIVTAFASIFGPVFISWFVYGLSVLVYMGVIDDLVSRTIMFFFVLVINYEHFSFIYTTSTICLFYFKEPYLIAIFCFIRLIYMRPSRMVIYQDKLPGFLSTPYNNIMGCIIKSPSIDYTTYVEASEDDGVKTLLTAYCASMVKLLYTLDSKDSEKMRQFHLKQKEFKDKPDMPLEDISNLCLEVYKEMKFRAQPIFEIFRSHPHLQLESLIEIAFATASNIFVESAVADVTKALTPEVVQGFMRFMYVMDLMSEKAFDRNVLDWLLRIPIEAFKDRNKIVEIIRSEDFDAKFKQLVENDNYVADYLIDNLDSNSKKFTFEIIYHIGVLLSKCVEAAPDLCGTISQIDGFIMKPLKNDKAMSQIDYYYTRLVDTNVPDKLSSKIFGIFDSLEAKTRSIILESETLTLLETEILGLTTSVQDIDTNITLILDDIARLRSLGNDQTEEERLKFKNCMKALNIQYAAAAKRKADLIKEINRKRTDAETAKALDKKIERQRALEAEKIVDFVKKTNVKRDHVSRTIKSLFEVMIFYETYLDAPETPAALLAIFQDKMKSTGMTTLYDVITQAKDIKLLVGKPLEYITDDIIEVTSTTEGVTFSKVLGPKSLCQAVKIMPGSRNPNFPPLYYILSVDGISNPNEMWDLLMQKEGCTGKFVLVKSRIGGVGYHIENGDYVLYLENDYIFGRHGEIRMPCGRNLQCGETEHFYSFPSKSGHAQGRHNLQNCMYGFKREIDNHIMMCSICATKTRHTHPRCGLTESCPHLKFTHTCMANCYVKTLIQCVNCRLCPKCTGVARSKNSATRCDDVGFHGFPCLGGINCGDTCLLDHPNTIFSEAMVSQANIARELETVKCTVDGDKLYADLSGKRVVYIVDEAFKVPNDFQKLKKTMTEYLFPEKVVHVHSSILSKNALISGLLSRLSNIKGLRIFKFRNIVTADFNVFFDAIDNFASNEFGFTFGKIASNNLSFIDFINKSRNRIDYATEYMALIDKAFGDLDFIVSTGDTIVNNNRCDFNTKPKCDDKYIFISSQSCPKWHSSSKCAICDFNGWIRIPFIAREKPLQYIMAKFLGNQYGHDICDKCNTPIIDKNNKICFFECINSSNF